MFCSRCGVSLAEGAQFCVDCGHTVEASFPAAPGPATMVACSKCSQPLYPGAHFCSHCGNTMPAAAIVAGSEGGAAAAAATAVDRAYWQHRRRWSRRKVASWGIALALVGAVSWLIASDRAMASQVKSFITTAHSETITDGSIAIKPHGFASYKVTVPAGAIDVGLMGQFEASGRGSNEVEVLLLTESELAVWQSGYATSPYFDSGTVAKAEIEAVLPSNAGEYYLVLSNKAGRVEKTVHVAAGLRYDTWLPDSLVDLKQKIVSWFE